MPAPTDFAKLVPGFDFLQGLMKNAGAAVPSMGQWIAPTLDPEEIEKRIEQLRTVQFWLEQNARMLSATIQALEVQRMTLSTLKTMNMPMDAMRESFKLRTPDAEAKVETKPEVAAKSSTPRKKVAPAAVAAAPSPVDPMQWWGALTQQFTELAKNALKDTATDAAKNLATQAIKSAVEMPGKMAAKVVGAGLAAGKNVGKTVRKR